MGIGELFIVDNEMNDRVKRASQPDSKVCIYCSFKLYIS
jgi:hypothetical protein